MCLPKACGGLNLSLLELWNKAAILKLLWSLETKKDRLWVRWMHTYYVKNNALLNCPIPKTSSWCSRKILGLGQLVSRLGGWDDFQDSKGQFSIRKAYFLLLGEKPHVPWSSLICNNLASPKAVFILWLTLHGRLNTAERIARWKPAFSPLCRVCGRVEETCSHLFGECPFVERVWSHVFSFLQTPIPWCTFAEQQDRMRTMSKKKTPLAKLIICCWTELLYEIWIQRNSCVFNNVIFSPRKVATRVLFKAACRVDDDVAKFLIT